MTSNRKGAGYYTSSGVVRNRKLWYNGGVMPPKGYSKYRNPVKTGYTIEQDSILWIKELSLKYKQSETQMLNHLLERLRLMQAHHPKPFESLVSYGPI
jgi:hypothetical protein